MKPRVVKRGCFWVVFRLGQFNWENDWTYNTCFRTWREALENALRLPINGYGR